MDFYTKIDRFNRMYKLGLPDHPMIVTKDELEKFHSILTEELSEVEELFEGSARYVSLVDLSDWLGDIIVYCHTFARSKGLPMKRILDAIMESNFSKLGSDGLPIYDERGKVLKGPHFTPPEPMIQDIICGEISNK